ncbi:MAG: hypothetical protein ACXWUK_09335 [Burkholderiales bacterium]
MTTLAKALAFNTEPVVAGNARVTRKPLAVVTGSNAVREQAAAEHVGNGNVLKTVALGLGAPFIGLAFVLAFPLMGLGMVLKYAAEAAWRRRGRTATFVKNVVLFLAAPFIGLAYAAMFPVMGLGMLAWTAGKAVVRRR